MISTTIRNILLDEIKKEIVGPHEKDESFVNEIHPKSKYLSGVLYPIQTPVTEDEDVKNNSIQIQSQDDTVNDEKIPINVGTKPSSMGLICKISIEQKSILATISYGRYLNNEKKKKEKNSVKENTSEKKYPDWNRIDCEVDSIELDVTKTNGKKELEPNVYLRYYVSKNTNHGYLTLNVFLTNEFRIKSNEFVDDSRCIFQPIIKLTSPDSSKVFLNISNIVDKKNYERNLSTEDKKLLFWFRNYKHFAQGRNCSVEWNINENEDKTNYVQTTFIPHYISPEIKPREPNKEMKKTLNMKYLASITNYKEFKNILKPIVCGYEEWIEILEKKRRVWEEETNHCIEKNFISNQVNTPKQCTDECRETLERICSGINKISTDPLAGESFRFANEVMYENILHSRWVKINREKILQNESISEDGPNFDDLDPEWRMFQLAFLLLNIVPITDPTSPYRKDTDLLWFPTGGGKTEAYYGIIAFTLSFRRLKGRGAKSREEELDRYGISIIMRYTYRLLTLQQFQRASTLLCACEYVRMKNIENREKFGTQPFLVGLWVGQETTPNSFKDAKKIIEQKRQNPNSVIETTDPMQLLNCPWCGRKLTAYNYEFSYPYDDPNNLRPRRIRIKCDKKCFFGKPNDPDRVLPVVFVDEDIRNLCPSLLISTVDKFAQISWNWRYSTFFGRVSQYCKEHGYRPGNISKTSSERCNHPYNKKFSNNKYKKIPVIDIKRNLAPPELIIQDELHLITGPLGTLTGLYETAIDILCENDKTGTKPKIIASTATTKKSDEQIQNLFNSKSTKIFPPLGYEFGESYFAEVLPTSNQHPGKLHVGVCSTSVGGYNIDSRMAACILRKIRHIQENKNGFYFNGKTYKFTDEELDTYYTLVSYYNTIKNLGGAVRMYEDTIPGYMGVIAHTSENKFQTQNNAEKYIPEILQKEELTGRVNAVKIPTIMKNIETKLGDKNVLDALLCTNMLSVGVDVERLNVMLINGQPKNTSEYIQASGRIGRKNPGIVITNYAYIRQRDLSYFENFIQFHSAYHKLVESSTSTPFSRRARDRGLSGIFLALIRLTNSILSDDPKMLDMNNPRVCDLTNKIQEQILKRVEEVDPSESSETEDDIKNIIKKWETVKNQFNDWVGGEGDLKYRRNPIYNKGKSNSNIFYLLNSSRDPYNENAFTIPESLREAESEISLYYTNNYLVKHDG